MEQVASAAKKRRITPLLLTDADVVSGTLSVSQPSSLPAFGEIGLQEQSRLSEQTIGPGRRVYVDLSVKREISLRQVLASKSSAVLGNFDSGDSVQFNCPLLCAGVQGTEAEVSAGK